MPYSSNILNDLNLVDNNKFEKKYVHTVYNNIANDFSSTRYKKWPNVAKFLEDETKDQTKIVLDIGCGNAKYCSSVSESSFYFGVDISFKLLENALLELKKKKLHTFKNCNIKTVDLGNINVLNIPVKNNVVDIIIAIAVIHHLSTKERRILAIRNALEKLVFNGKMLIYVWAKDHDVNSIGFRKFERSDVILPWITTKSKEAHLRYYHVYTEEDFLSEIKSAIKDLATMYKYYFDNNNWCCILIKQ